MLYYVRSYKHIEALWFANTANSLLWWTYVKAFWRALNSVFGEKIKFKTTLKGERKASNVALQGIASDISLPYIVHAEWRCNKAELEIISYRVE